MKPGILVLALLVAAGVQAAEAPTLAPLAPLPAGWSTMTGNGGPLALPGTCDSGVDREKSTAERQIYTVRCSNAVLPSHGGARNTVQTARFRGKRVRVSAWLMASGVESVPTPQYAGVAGEGGLWIGVGSPGSGVSTDRMQNRAIRGSTDWEYRDFVVDVPADNRQMLIGYWMQGKGQLWVRDFVIEEVPATVAVNFLVKDPERVTGPDLSLFTSMEPRPNEIFLPPPAKWLSMGGKGFELCDAGVDAKMLKDGQRNLSIACSVPQTPVLRQAFQAAPFWGKRVRLSASLRVENFEPLAGNAGREGVGLFLNNTDGQAQSIRADVSGTTGWQYRELVMDVPRNATWLLIGLSLSGRGQVWARDLKFEEVSRDTPLTQPGSIRF